MRTTPEMNPAMSDAPDTAVDTAHAVDYTPASEDLEAWALGDIVDAGIHEAIDADRFEHGESGRG